MLATTSNDRSSVLRVLPSEIHAAGSHVCALAFLLFVICFVCALQLYKCLH